MPHKNTGTPGSHSRESRASRIVVLISGSGSNLQALMEAAAGQRLGGGEIVAVISNRPDAGGLKRAAGVGIPGHSLNHRDYPDRPGFDRALSTLIDGYRPDLVVLAGFMRILTDDFVNHYQGRLINIHPSLLPAYPGLHTHRRALEAGDREHGATVHFVTAQLDGGPAIVQGRVPVLRDDTPERLAARVLTQEHRIYPAAVRWFCQGRLQLGDNGVLLDGAPLAHPVDAGDDNGPLP
ncbi:MAG: phosphoribosylglycinamide formyltransferase [Oleiphilaceae bacterium]|nr:phosphoribosylglycinamide formyltransferase [Oleiphilaceae bacterium]